MIRTIAPTVMPGRDFQHTAALLVSDAAPGHLTSLPELPARGHHASLLGRSVAQLSELYAELTSYGWRLVQRPGLDHTRASTTLTSDVDTLADVHGEQDNQHDDVPALQIEILGPLSAAAALHLPGGEKVLSDHGARRDLTESLAAGVLNHVAHVQRALAPSELQVVVLEPEYTRVRTGTVPTVSGYQTLRALGRDETRQHLGHVTSALRSAGAERVILDLGEPVQAEHVQDFRTRSEVQVDGFALPVHQLVAADWERAAELVEAGAEVLASLLSAAELTAVPQVSELTRRLTGPWEQLGMPTSSLAAFSLSAAGARDRGRLAGVSEVGAMRTLARLTDTAAALTDHLHR